MMKLRWATRRFAATVFSAGLLSLCMTVPAYAGDTTAENWVGQVYSNQNLLGPPVINGADGSWPGVPRLNFNWGTGGPNSLVSANQFSGRFLKQLKIDKGGKYLFQAAADDGIKVYLSKLLSYTLQDSDQSIVYTGNWNTYLDPRNLGGTARYTGDNDAALTLNFSGSGISIGGYKSNDYGIADVYIDGTKVGTIDYYSPTSQFQQVLFQASNLSNTAHSLKLVYTGNKNALATGTKINADYFTVSGDGGTLQETGPNVVYSGMWNINSDQANLGSCAKYSDDSEASASIAFTGSSIKIGGYSSNQGGIADVYLDGGKVGSVDYYSPTVQYQKVLFQMGGLSNQPHTLKLVRTGNKNPQAAGTQINLDFFVTGAENGDGTFEDTNPSILYSGTWDSRSDSQNSGGTAKDSNDPNASFGMSFSGSYLKIIGYKSAWSGIGDVYIDGNKVGSIDYYSSAAQFQQTLFEKTGLTTGTHVLKVVHTGSKNQLATGTNINIDNVVVSSGPFNFEETGSNVSYTGVWNNYSDSRNSGSSAKFSSDTGASVSAAFTGPTIKIGGYKSTEYGIADVYIDGIKAGSIDYYSPTAQFQQTLFQKTGLTNAPHVLKLVVTGNKNPQAGGSNIDADCFAVGDGLGTYQDSDANISYSGVWKDYLSQQNSGGSAKYTNSTGSAFNFNFTGSSISVGGYKSAWFGIGDVYIDGNKVGSVDYYYPTVQFQQSLFSIAGLTNAPHTLKVECTGRKNPLASGTKINVDYISVGQDQGLGTFQEDNALFLYSGNWQTYQESGNSGGSAKYSPDNKAAVSVNFSGSSLKLGGYRSTWLGIADVYIDGNKVGSIDYYSPTAQFQQILFEKTGLTNAPHTLQLVTTGAKNPQSIGTKINIDFIQVESGLGTFEDTNPNVTYCKNWTSYAAAGNSGGTAMYSNESGASLSFNFTGPSIQVGGYRSNWYGIGDVYIDGNKVGSIDYYSPTAQFQQVLYEKRGLNNGPHNITIVETGQKNPLAAGTSINVDYFRVNDGYATYQETDNNASALDTAFSTAKKQLVIDSWKSASGSVSNSISLEPGLYQVFVEYYHNNTANANLSLDIYGPATHIPARPSPYGPDYYQVKNGSLNHYLPKASWTVGPAPSLLVEGNTYVRDQEHRFYLRTATDDYYVGTYVPPYEALTLKSTAKVTAADIDNYIRSVSPYSPLIGSGRLFIDAQNKYGVNAQYLVANAGLESAWGTSRIARYKHNLFGYAAYDSSPYASAATFISFSNSILFQANIVNKNYLDPSGKYYHAATLDGMNVHYATDPDWAEKIAAIMDRMRAYQSSDYTNAAN